MSWKRLLPLIFLLGLSACTKMGFSLWRGAVVHTNPQTDPPGGPSGPPASEWLGTNLAWNDNAYIDITHILTPFTGTLDSNGYPVAGTSGNSNTDIGFRLPTGDYKISYRGTGTVVVGGIATMNGAWQTAGGEHRGVMHLTGYPGLFGKILNLAISNGPGQSVTDLHIYFPGYDYDEPAIFLPTVIAQLAPFGTFRFMDFLKTNGSTIANWSDRPRADRFGASANGEPYEFLVELINSTGRDAWINIPAHASDDFLHQFAAFLRDHLDFNRIQTARRNASLDSPFTIYLEFSNETWNNSFEVASALYQIAQANPSRYDATYTADYNEIGPRFMVDPTYNPAADQLIRDAKVAADKLILAKQIFQSEFATAGRSSSIKAIYAGWSLGPGYQEAGLEFVSSHYGRPSDYIDYLAIAGYFNSPDANTGNLNSLFTSLNAAIDAYQGTFDTFKSFGERYGLKIVGYEGGQGFTGTANENVKFLAQYDVRMYTAYLRFLALWKHSFGNQLFMNFSLAGNKGIPVVTWNIRQYGFWEVIPSALTDPDHCGDNLRQMSETLTLDPRTPDPVMDFCPKYKALREAGLN